MRRIDPAVAALSNLVALGLGYVYVGRIRFAFALLATMLLVTAFAGWLRVVFHPHLLYLAGIVMLLVGLFPVIHCTLIASRNREMPARPYNKWWAYIAWMVGSSIAIQGLIALRPALLGYESFRIPTISMAPILDRGDFIMVDTWRFDRTDPAYQELVVFDTPGAIRVKYVARLVGLPGDTLEIRDDVLYRNGQRVDESYIQLRSGAPDTVRNFGPETLADGSFFMLGDNRHNSRDSRFVGTIPREFLHGRVEHRWFSYNEGIRWERFPYTLAVEDD